MAVWELTNCLRVDLRALTAGQVIVCIRLHIIPRTHNRPVPADIWGPAIFASDYKSLVATQLLSSYSGAEAVNIAACRLSRGGTLQDEVGERINSERTFSLLSVRSHVTQFSFFEFLNPLMAWRSSRWIFLKVHEKYICMHKKQFLSLWFSLSIYLSIYLVG